MASKKLIIDIERCKGCDLCVIYCPKKCIKLSDGFNKAGTHYLVLADEDKCNSCGTCYIMCPDCAIEVSK